MSEVRKTSSSSATRGVVYDLAQARARQPAAEPPTPADSAGFSDRARELARANAAVREAADLREERIRALRARIADGTYRPDAREIAHRIVEEGL